jgi:hypothetical protein
LFGLLELEMADLSIFFEKNDLRPLGVNKNCNKYWGQNTYYFGYSKLWCPRNFGCQIPLIGLVTMNKANHKHALA